MRQLLRAQVGRRLGLWLQMAVALIAAATLVTNVARADTLAQALTQSAAGVLPANKEARLQLTELQLTESELGKLQQSHVAPHEALDCAAGWAISWTQALDVTRPQAFLAKCKSALVDPKLAVAGGQAVGALGDQAVTGVAQFVWRYPVWVARVALLRGAQVSAQDVELVWQGAAPASLQPVGMQVKRRVRAGQPLSAQLLEPTPLLRRGQKVNVIAADAAVRASLEAEVLADAGLGERVRVRNTGSRKVIEGVVRDAHTVVVDL